MTVTVNLPRSTGSGPVVVLPRAKPDVVTVTKEVVVYGDRDEDGNVVPTHKGHSYSYDSSGNLATDTVTDGDDVWVRTYTWANGAQTSDSGWVKQNG